MGSVPASLASGKNVLMSFSSPINQVEVEFKKAWAAANFSVDGGGGASAAELEEARGKRNSALLARQKFEQEAPKAVGGVSAPKSGSKKV